MPEQENQPLEMPSVVVAAAPSSLDSDSGGEYKAMLHRAKRLRLTGNGILVAVGGLLLFGGYVFFQAASITTKDQSVIFELARVKYEMEKSTLELTIAQQASEISELKAKLTALIPDKSPTPMPTATTTPTP